jgi:hypothetical protein
MTSKKNGEYFIDLCLHILNSYSTNVKQCGQLSPSMLGLTPMLSLSRMWCVLGFGNFFFPPLLPAIITCSCKTRVLIWGILAAGKWGFYLISFYFLSWERGAHQVLAPCIFCYFLLSYFIFFSFLIIYHILLAIITCSCETVMSWSSHTRNSSCW